MESYDTTSTRWLPHITETLLAAFGIDDANLTTAFCAQYGRLTTAEVDCSTGGAARMYLDRDITITRVGVVVGDEPWGTTEACDVALAIDGTEIAADASEFEMGASGFRASGDAATKTLTQAATAGSVLTVRHSDPDAPATYCVSGSGCDCDTADGTYQYRVYGYYD